jgi:protein SCO1/2
MIYFGYTNCPDICPTTLFEMGAALDLLGSDARTKVQPIFVTVDPDRDTPPSIKAYLEPLGHGFIGVTGSTAAVDAYAWDHQVVVMRSIGEGQTYTVDHTSSVLLLAPDGSVAERFPYEMDYREVARRMGERIVGSPLAREGASAR